LDVDARLLLEFGDGLVEFHLVRPGERPEHGHHRPSIFASQRLVKMRLARARYFRRRRFGRRGGLGGRGRLSGRRRFSGGRRFSRLGLLATTSGQGQNQRQQQHR